MGPDVANWTIIRGVAGKGFLEGGDLLRPPTPRQRQIDLADGMLGDAGEHIRHPSLWIHIVQAGGLDDRIEVSRAAGRRATNYSQSGNIRKYSRIAVSRQNIGKQLKAISKRPRNCLIFVPIHLTRVRDFERQRKILRSGSI
jgi:hypothetical protein